MEKTEIEKSKSFIVSESLEYVPNSVVLKHVIRKTTGKLSAVSFASGETLMEKIYPFDTFIHIIDCKAEIIIDEISRLSGICNATQNTG